MKKMPRILITTGLSGRGIEFHDLSHDVSDRYVRAVLAAGGLPLLLPPPEHPRDEALLAEAVAQADGLILSGGVDVSPELYLKRALPARLKATLSSLSPRRDWAEMVLIRQAGCQRKPLLAICRGLQVLNVALGGTLIADIPLQTRTTVPHNCPEKKSDFVHSVRVKGGSLLERIVQGRELWVNSTHHQAVRRVAPGLRATACAPDGLVEALEAAPGRWPAFLLAVQFHPERLFEKEKAHQAIFQHFLAACQNNSG